MQIKFEIDEVMIMDLLVSEATNASRENREVFRRGKRLLTKLSINSEFLRLKRRELVDISEILKVTLKLAGDIDTSKDKESDKENREANVKLMESCVKKIAEKLNDQR